jgi:hypothetical protein
VNNVSLSENLFFKFPLAAIRDFSEKIFGFIVHTAGNPKALQGYLVARDKN